MLAGPVVLVEVTQHTHLGYITAGVALGAGMDGQV